MRRSPRIPLAAKRINWHGEPPPSPSTCAGQPALPAPCALPAHRPGASAGTNQSMTRAGLPFISSRRNDFSRRFFAPYPGASTVIIQSNISRTAATRQDTAGHGTARHACQHTPSGKHDSPDRPCSLHTFSPTLHIFAPHTARPPISHFPARAQSHRHTQYTTPPASFAQYRRNFVTRSPAGSHPRRIRRSPQKSQTRTCSTSRYNPLLFFQGAFQRQQTSAPGGSTT